MMNTRMYVIENNTRWIVFREITLRAAVAKIRVRLGGFNVAVCIWCGEGFSDNKFRGNWYLCRPYAWLLSLQSSMTVGMYEFIL